MDITPPPVPPADPPAPPASPRPQAGPPAEPPPTSAPPVAADHGRLVRLGFVVAGALLVTTAIPLLVPLAGAVLAGGDLPYRFAAILHVAVGVGASIIVALSRRAMPWWVVAAVLVTGILPAVGAVVTTSDAVPMFGGALVSLAVNAVGALWPVALLFAVLAEVRPQLPGAARSWTVSVRLGAVASGAGLLTALLFGVMFATRWMSVGRGTWGVTMLVQGVAGTVVTGLMLLTALHAVCSAVRTRAVALDPTRTPVTHPAVGAVVALGVMTLVLVRFGFMALGMYF